MKRILACVMVVGTILTMLNACGQNTEAQWQEQYDLVVRYLSEGNYEEAIIAFTAAIEIDPSAADGYLMLADVYTAIEEPGQAAQVLYLGWQNCSDDAQTFVDRLGQIGYIIDEDGELVSVQELETAAFSAYQKILDLIYYGIIDQWEWVESRTPTEVTESITYLWYQYPVRSLSDAGYMLVDLNDDSIPELITSIAAAASEGGSSGMIYNLYTIIDGNIARVVSSSERDRYYLCTDQRIANEGSSGAADSVYRFYDLEQGSGSLNLIEMVRYYGMGDSSTPWFYGTTDTYDITGLTNISEEKAQRIIKGYTHMPITLTLFDKYAPGGSGSNDPADIPTDNPENESTNDPTSEPVLPEVKPSDNPAQETVAPTTQNYLPIDYVGITVAELAALHGSDFTYDETWFLGASKGIYYSDLRVPFIFYYLDLEYQSNATGSEGITMVECSPSASGQFNYLAPGIPMDTNYTQLLNADYSGTFYDGDSGMWMSDMGETSKFIMDYSGSISITFYWFNNADPYSEVAGNVIISE